MIPSHVRIFVCTEPVDMRRSFDGLALAARERLGKDPREGGLFVFANKRSNRLKVLWFDRNGYCLLYKRLHRALFRMPGDGSASAVQIDAAGLGALLAGVDRPRRRGEDVRERKFGTLQ
ncbi:IS66 family insertion sequence element accessory protein TnpB [Candidatus Binatia bacterium]|nr:IS66 family insertion sequence element accessory protein TnpB [Candidatus Binatia bacterium]